MLVVYDEPQTRESGAVAFAPTDVAGLKQWLAVRRETAYANNDPVGTLTDFSGNGIDATGTGTARPTFKTNIQNGLPGVESDNSNDLMLFTPIALAKAHTYFLVIKTGWNGVVVAGTPPVYVYYNAGDAHYYRGVSVSDTRSGGVEIYALRRNGTAIEFFKNGAQQGTTQTYGPNADTTIDALFAMDDGTARMSVPNTLLEWCVWDSALSDPNMALTWSYLNGLYAVY